MSRTKWTEESSIEPGPRRSANARAALDKAREAGRLPLSGALDNKTVGAWFFEPLSDKSFAE